MFANVYVAVWTIGTRVSGAGKPITWPLIPILTVVAVLPPTAQAMLGDYACAPDVVAYPEHGYAWVATRDPEPGQLEKGGDPGIIARFEIPIE